MHWLTAFLIALTVGLSPQGVGAEPLDRPEVHAAAGLAAAERWPGFASLCDLDARMRNVNVPRARTERAEGGGALRSGSGRAGAIRAARAALPPMRVFDNLFFLGLPSVSAWLYGTEEGYVLIDALNTDEEAEEAILGGMAALGLEPAAITQVLVTHAHGDHYGGADHIARTLGIEVVMSETDWDLAARLGPHPRYGPPPRRGLTVADGEVLRFGRSSLTVHLTPGHTPGTISPVFEVFDGGRRHVAMLWGGAGFNFGPDVGTFLTYAASARRMREAARTAGVDVLLSNHVRRDGTDRMMAALAERAPGAPHPMVSGEPGHALFDVLEQCALAQAARFSERRE